MKKIISFIVGFILVIAIACVVAVNRNTVDNNEKSGSVTGGLDSSPKVSLGEKEKQREEKKEGKKEEPKVEKKLAKKVKSKGKDTLLIYMVGSDLESRSGAGTDDLKEIEESGIDTKKANVLVYAGGAPKWHNDIVYEGKNTILQLGKEGFEPVAEMSSSNMGITDTLLEFLEYSCENYPSDSYSLIMWDHGNGPVIGYGKDMLFDNDSLTLLEMDNALKASPFGKDKKLEWVGFDACLMSSAELVCIWDDYAKYLVASQEVEPSFGWNYSFLKDFGIKETADLIQDIAEQYMSACNAYYAKKGYDDRDTTLACMNLTYAGELENAINNLFAKADADVYTNYNTLVSKRVGTRAFGRASTGSEYDLIDLNDMAEQLSEVYPEESKRLGEIIKKTVIKNVNNTKDCCGISIYYPFYNKYYYEDSWAEAYGRIGLFANYKSYLNKYQEIWLKDDKLDEYVSGNTPEKASEDDNRSGFEFDKGNQNQTYELELTSEQNKNFAEAKVYVLAREGKDKYHVVFSDNNVINKDGILSFEFEGKGIYVKNKFCEYYLPVSKGYDSVGDVGRYSLKIRGKNIEEEKLQDALFNIALNKKTGDVTLSSINPYSALVSSQNIVGGKLEELDINAWDYIFPMRPDYKYLQRYNNGLVKPIEEWIGDSGVSYYKFCIRDEIDFVYSALDDGKYSLIFEITDTQNNKYCSEPVDIDIKSEEKETYKPEEINIEWTDGERIKIFETEGSVLYLKKIYDRKGINYVLEAENNNDYSINYYFDNIIINGNILNGMTSIDVKPNQKESNIFGISSYDLTNVGVIDSIFSISGKLKVQVTSDTNIVDIIKTIETNQIININISGNALESNLKERFPKYEFNLPFCGAHSGEQEIYNDGKIRIILFSFGKADGILSSGFISVENLTDEEQLYTIDSYSVNGFTIDGGESGVLPPKCKEYGFIPIGNYEMKKAGISVIKELKVKISLYQDREQYYNRVSDESCWVDINLKLDGTANDISEEDAGRIVFDKNDVKIILTEYGIEYDRPTWKLMVENESDLDITVEFGDENSVSSPYAGGLPVKVASHNRAISEISAYTYKEIPEKFSMKVYVMDYSGTQILYTSDQTFELKVVPLNIPEEEITADWTNGDEKALDVRNGVTLGIKKLDWHGDLCYALELKNTTDKDVSYEIKDVIINGNIVENDVDTMYADANESRIGVKVPYYSAITDFGAIDEIHSISFRIKENSGFVLPTALNDHKFNVNISGDARINNFAEIYKPLDLSEAFYGAKAQRQEVLNNDKIKVEFLGFGGTYHPEIRGEGYYASEYTSGDYGFCVENISQSYQTVAIESVSINEVDIHMNKKSVKIPPGCKAYISDYIADYNADVRNVISVSAIAEISYAISVQEEGSTDEAKSVWVSIKTEADGAKEMF